MMPHILNRDTRCASLDPALLDAVLDSARGRPGLAALVHARNPHLFSAQPVFASQLQIDRIAAVAAALERVWRLPQWQQAVLGDAPATAQHQVDNPGLFLGIDFHVEGDAIGLIEINTNPGGALLSAALARAQRACSAELAAMAPAADAVDAFEADLLQMFIDEWRSAGRSGAPQRIAIVDADPQQQYLYAEFVLFQRLFERAGIAALVVDPSRLQVVDGRLLADGQAIDLVYNRLTDFALLEPAHAALRQAWEHDLAVIAPHPRAHALLADKRNLVRLGDAAALQQLGASSTDAQLLAAHVPTTRIVDAATADALWQQRRQLFFKPWSGFGGRAAYRGAKLTQGVWQQIVAGDYVAQQLMAPGARHIGDDAQELKFDLRAFVSGGRLLWLTARLYQGQTTNFRTPGGGFAPVYIAPQR